MMMVPRRSLLAGALALPACATTPKTTPAFARAPLPALRMEPERITHITVCLRPFRAAGPRLDVETIGNKRVVHNYGHGGSGWSLSWGSAALAARNAMADGARDIAVIGCGALGLTAALTLLRAGAKVTIYASERLPQTRSARATGTWSPSSRIADENAVSPQFPALWEAMARTSFAIHRSMVGLPGDPVVWSDRYTLFGSGTEPLNIELFAQASGLTMAERAVLKGLSRGLDPTELAQANGVAVSTVRTQIVRIRQKTRTGSIRALLNVVNNLPPVVCATELRA